MEKVDHYKVFTAIGNNDVNLYYPDRLRNDFISHFRITDIECKRSCADHKFRILVREIVIHSHNWAIADPQYCGIAGFQKSRYPQSTTATGHVLDLRKWC
ncbi:hypothetical protein RCL_jg25784.t1 [Rhizophagus clarus]|uniref:Uncharacterized protein n=1 Tax=Rhizophagus clarus TaxID=94130 RepID=A0A8H3QTA2_9GLOM|nr:hypothetical protein RCL_jg25784.t1 [Rhizophagus clarus]